MQLSASKTRLTLPNTAAVQPVCLRRKIGQPPIVQDLDQVSQGKRQ
jgi:hypothetical protein